MHFAHINGRSMPYCTKATPRQQSANRPYSKVADSSRSPSDYGELMSRPSPIADVRGAGRLVAELTVLITDVVETMHRNIARPPGISSRATLEPTRGITGFVYRSVRGVTRAVGSTIDTVLRPLEPLFTAPPSRRGRDAVVSGLNGVLGDRLEASSNPLAIPMQLRVRGVPLALARAEIARVVPQPRNRIVVMAHGLCMSDTMWNRQEHDHGQRLAQDLQADVVYLRYNSGRHISTNGAEFAMLLERMVATWPVPVRDLVLIGHSMGGLVIRSACAAGEASGQRWMRPLRALVFLGTPHHGAPLERGGHGMDMLFNASRYTVAFARLGQLRSAGITDLRYGSVLDRDWTGRDRFWPRRPSAACTAAPAECAGIRHCGEPEQGSAPAWRQAPWRWPRARRQRARPTPRSPPGHRHRSDAPVDRLRDRPSRPAWEQVGVRPDETLARRDTYHIGPPVPGSTRRPRSCVRRGIGL